MTKHEAEDYAKGVISQIENETEFEKVFDKAWPVVRAVLSGAKFFVGSNADRVLDLFITMGDNLQNTLDSDDENDTENEG